LILRSFTWRDAVRVALCVIVVAATVWAVAAAFGATFSYRLGPVRATSRDPFRPLLLAAIAAGLYVLLFGVAAAREELERLARIPAPVLRWAPVFLVLLTLGLGLRWSTYAAAGSDSYGYVSQADLWLNGHLRVAQPWSAPFEWPNADWTFSPLGYRPGPEPHTIVPTYAAGVPMMMALAKAVVGPIGVYLVVPVLGALSVWFTYRIGKRLAGDLEGTVAAALVATSPAVLFSLMFPMSDIAAMAFWTLAAFIALGRRRIVLVLAGLASSMAIIIRPNLVPVAGAIALLLVFRRRPGRFAFRSILADLAVFATGLAPGIVGVAALNAHLYGSPFASGYGNAPSLFALGMGTVNARHYAAWLWQTQPAAVVLAGLGLILTGGFRPRHGDEGPRVPPKLVVVAMIGAVLLCYLFYLAFDDWWYLRFLLPAFPFVMVAAAAGLARLARFAPEPWRPAIIVFVLVAIVASQSRTAINRGAYDLQAGEYHYITAARAVDARVPANAMVICMQHSGSLRYYGHRPTLRWDWLPPDWLDRAVASLEAHGYRPYLLLEDWEVPRFRARFAGSAVARLLDRPIAVVSPGVALYDPIHE
jgi:hypothetical protein